MTRKRALMIGGIALGLMASGGVVAGALQDVPQDAQPVQDPVGDLLREQTPPTVPPAPPDEAAPAGTPAPAAPVVIIPTQPIVVAEAPTVEDAEEEEETAPVPAKAETPVVPDRRQRRRVAIVEAIDKVTAERMRFEVAVGGRPVRFNQSLVFTARACEVSAPDEPVRDAIAYMEVVLEPRAKTRNTEAREVFKGWMFASTPAVSGLQHPNYDAWIVGCKA